MKTFGQMLIEHTKLCSDKARTAREILSSAKNATDPEARTILSRLASQYIADIDEMNQLFESKFAKELKTLQTISEDSIK